jgi:hypothetical protein
MDKHTPLTKITRTEESETPPEERQYSKERIKNTKKSKVPLIPA